MLLAERNFWSKPRPLLLSHFWLKTGELSIAEEISGNLVANADQAGEGADSGKAYVAPGLVEYGGLGREAGGGVAPWEGDNAGTS